MWLEPTVQDSIALEPYGDRKLKMFFQNWLQSMTYMVINKDFEPKNGLHLNGILSGKGGKEHL